MYRQSCVYVPRKRVATALSLALTGAVCSLLGACAPKSPGLPANIVVSAQPPHAWPAVPVAAPGAPPRIVRIWFSTLTLEPGIWFDGTIVASSNVASVEVRTAAFSINSTHVAPGVYHFHTRVLELPPLSRRHSYDLFIIARNTAGAQQIEHAPLRVE